MMRQNELLEIIKQIVSLAIKECLKENLIQQKHFKPAVYDYCSQKTNQNKSSTVNCLSVVLSELIFLIAFTFCVLLLNCIIVSLKESILVFFSFHWLRTSNCGLKELITFKSHVFLKVIQKTNQIRQLFASPI